MARLAGCGVGAAGDRAQAGRLLDRLGLVGRDAEALGDRVGDVAAAHEQDAHEARHAALVDDDVGDARADVDERLGLDAPKPCSAATSDAQDGEAA